MLNLSQATRESMWCNERVNTSSLPVGSNGRDPTAARLVLWGKLALSLSLSLSLSRHPPPISCTFLCVRVSHSSLKEWASWLTRFTQWLVARVPLNSRSVARQRLEVHFPRQSRWDARCSPKTIEEQSDDVVDGRRSSKTDRNWLNYGGEWGGKGVDTRSRARHCHHGTHQRLP